MRSPPAEGYYLIGREDGGAEPILVQIEEDGGVVGPMDRCNEVRAAVHDIQCGIGLWWWRRMEPTQFAPSDLYLDSMPEFPVPRGGLL